MINDVGPLSGAAISHPVSIVNRGREADRRPAIEQPPSLVSHRKLMGDGREK